MASAAEHYDRHLGPVYTWMVGDVAAAMAQHREELRQLGLASGTTAVAVDLGAGPGLHAIPLAELGFSVVALEQCAPLAAELRERAAGLPVRVVQADLLAFRQHQSGPIAVALCMGDTLTHLPSRTAVAQLLGDVAAALVPGGIFLATFRDYTSRELQGNDRFILVRADESRILTCFLEYEEAVMIVHDLLHERGEDGWRLTVSSYPKLRLDPAWVRERLEALGLSVHLDTTRGGMVRMVARRG